MKEEQKGISTSERWIRINPRHFVKVPHWIRPSIYVYEVNPLGEVRLFNPLGDVVTYKPVKLIEISGIKYFSFTLGAFRGVQIRSSIPILRIVERYF